ncbi:MAG: serine/threonine-protein phosphatase [Gemmatimonadales bacterium]|nr:serine/threonine-protein phosphatase [Gemmatimonadales bacterium]
MATAQTIERKPRDEELDVYGLTHPGKVRPNNQDHFLICSLHREVVVHSTSLPLTGALGLGGERLAFLAMVADGVGGGPKGEEASRVALESVTEYVVQCTRCYYAADIADTDAFTGALADAAMKCHAVVTERASVDAAHHGMATTLTMWIGVWPNAYLLQVGDSRCYAMSDGRLTQLSRDQTMAQELIDQGILTRAKAPETRWSSILSSSIGGRQTEPVITRIEQRWGNVGLLCSDGLTRHVTDEQIGERLRTMTSAKQVCEALLQDALDGGGTDNITIIVGRTTEARQQARE